ncbi:MAG: DNA polymerase III subunit gamma/tau, partial [Acutalibacteraceae bacterium]|nr:DNA polymerase III subunit gamma/tau [Acutalibacteraceae bacterium]
MAYQALYRKYRPTKFSDVVGQDHITKTLKNELDSGKIVHAYLFTGTRGTGKTTCAKILAKAINCLNSKGGDPCGECEICRMIANDEITDIVEMDAASNNGVDDIRELREQVNFAPATAKYRVYIIDEVHMLSGAAFNALLKTLEEPPEHVVFILATTEVHKLPATILSRCQRFDFRRIDSAEIVGRLKYVAENEGLNLTDDAATLIASAADGGMRDALSILDLCASTGSDITEDTVSNVCSMAGNDYLIKMTDLIK